MQALQSFAGCFDALSSGDFMQCVPVHLAELKEELQNVLFYSRLQCAGRHPSPRTEG